jgi:hypothetical protein
MNKMKIALIYTSLIFILIIPCSIKGQDIGSGLSAEIEILRAQKNRSINVQKLLKYNNTLLLDSIKEFDSDSSSNIRFNMMLLEFKILNNNINNPVLRKEVVNRFVNRITDPDNVIQQYALQKLITFSPLDFDQKSVQTLKKIITTEDLSKNLILLIGIANIRELNNFLLQKVNFNPITSTEGFNSTNWPMQLVLARMGNVESINYCVNSFDNCTDEITKITYLLKELSFTKSKSAVLCIKKYLFNTNTFPPLKAGRKGTPYCRYALDALANMLEEFPIKANEFGYTDEEIETARKWMNSHSQFKIKQ